jgi:AraC-like DNA-binding protein
VIFPHGSAHELMSRDGIKVPEDAAVSAKILARDLSPLRLGGTGEESRFACGYMACDELVYKTILASLPKVFKVNIRSDQSGQWLESSILHLLGEAASGNPGSRALLAKLSEALFVDILRKFMGQLDSNAVGLLAGARDPLVGKCLALMHGNIAHPWTLPELASRAGTSRSALTERFGRLLGMPPMSHLTGWRMQLAARALASTSKATSLIAADVGYESEAAFNRAFKREFQLPPARYRRELKKAAVAISA